MQVWKYPLSFGVNRIDMPFDAKILSTHKQHGTVCVWALVNPNHGPDVRNVLLCGTGHEISSQVEHVGTVIDGSFVWHVFEILD